jgi:hypothetical protein
MGVSLLTVSDLIDAPMIVPRTPDNSIRGRGWNGDVPYQRDRMKTPAHSVFPSNGGVLGNSVGHNHNIDDDDGR